jgi:hypothetical protein
MKVYFPSWSDGASKGISLFGNKAVVSPSTVFPNEAGPIYGNDPAAEWLEKEGIRYMKTDDLKKNPMLAAFREALSYKDRTVLQLVNLGLSQNGGPIYLQPGQGNVETYFVYANDFDSKWTRPLFTEVIERGRHPFDPGWYGIHFGISVVCSVRPTVTPRKATAMPCALISRRANRTGRKSNACWHRSSRGSRSCTSPPWRR